MKWMLRTMMLAGRWSGPEKERKSQRSFRCQGNHTDCTNASSQGIWPWLPLAWWFIRNKNHCLRKARLVPIIVKAGASLFEFNDNLWGNLFLLLRHRHRLFKEQVKSYDNFTDIQDIQHFKSFPLHIVFPYFQEIHKDYYFNCTIYTTS